MFQELIDAAFYSREAYNKGMVGGTGGNTSVLIGNDMYISPTGCTLGDLQPEDFVRVPLDGQFEPREDGVRPSKEEALHKSIYLARPDIKAVLHLHPVNTIAATLLLDSLDEEMPAYTGSFFVKIGRAPQVPPFKAGSKELCEGAAACFKVGDCALLRNHGLIVGASSIKKAFTQTEEVEANARVHLLMHGKGALSDDDKKVLLG